VLAGRLLQAAPLAVRATKEIARRGQDMSLIEAVRFGETMRRVAAQTEDAKSFRVSTAKGDRPRWKAR
jgi:E-phenylitaconyl-CoA hydratase